MNTASTSNDSAPTSNTNQTVGMSQRGSLEERPPPLFADTVTYPRLDTLRGSARVV